MTEMPEIMKQMSVHDKEEFLKASTYGTAKRYCIRVIMVGEKSREKTCVLKRLMQDDLVDITSAEFDGINNNRRECKIDLQNGKWYSSTSK